MQIKVNEEEIDYKLEHEKNIGEVISGVRAWLQSGGFVLTGATVGERELNLLEEDSLRDILIDEVDILRVKAQTVLEKAYDDLTAIRAFFIVLKNALTADDTEAINKVLENYPYVRGGLDPLFEREGIATEILNSGTLHERLTACGLTEGTKGSEESLRLLIAFIDETVASIELRLHEMENPNSALVSAAAELRQAVEQLSEVSVMLQTGRDPEAMQVIIHFAELSARIIRLYPSLQQTGAIDFAKILVDGVSFPDFYSDFNGVLGELIDAFSAEDSVLIGDLLEYEVSPRLEILKSYIDLLTGA